MIMKSGSPLPVGLIEGNAYQVVNQLAGVGIAVVLGVAGTFVILKAVDLTIGLRVSEEEELVGLNRILGDIESERDLFVM